MKLEIDPEFQALIPPLTAEELRALRAAIAKAGRVLDPIKVWRGRIADGHNRYAIATELGLPFDVQEIDLPDREAVKAWMLTHQAARRSLTRDQRCVLFLMHGQPAPADCTQREVETAAEAIAEGFGPRVLSGALTLRYVRNRLHPPKPRQRPPQGPDAEAHIPAGHELAGLSTLTGPDGAVRGAWSKTRVAGAEEPEYTPVPEGHQIERTSTMLRGDGSTSVQWISASPEKIAHEKAVLAAWARHALLYAGLADPVPAPERTDSDLLNVIPIGDPHIGMLAWAPETGDHFDTTIACRELLCCVRELLARAPKADRIILGNLGDAMHAQDDLARTPGHGNALDVDGRYAKVLDALHVLCRGLVDAALATHKHVTFRSLPGNHDPRVAAELMMWLRAVYEREPRVTIADAHAAHQYDHFGVNLIGWHHGDRSKKGELPAIMAADHDGSASGLWGQTSEHVWHVGHEHHKTVLETPSCMVEVHNTLAGRDAYHAGRYRAKRMLQIITYHRVFGEDERHTVNLARVRAALLAAGVSESAT